MNPKALPYFLAVVDWMSGRKVSLKEKVTPDLRRA